MFPQRVESAPDSPAWTSQHPVRAATTHSSSRLGPGRASSFHPPRRTVAVPQSDRTEAGRNAAGADLSTFGDFALSNPPPADELGPLDAALAGLSLETSHEEEEEEIVDLTSESGAPRVPNPRHHQTGRVLTSTGPRSNRVVPSSRTEEPALQQYCIQRRVVPGLFYTRNENGAPQH